MICYRTRKGSESRLLHFQFLSFESCNRKIRNYSGIETNITDRPFLVLLIPAEFTELTIYTRAVLYFHSFKRFRRS